VVQAKAQCGVAEGNEAHDSWFTDQIVTARRQVEYDLEGFVFYTGAHTLKLTSFGQRDWFDLTKWPATAITSIVYTATDGTSTTWSSSEYELKTFRKRAIVALAYGYNWPSVRGDINGITVTFTAGYASVPAMPPEAKDLVRLAIHVSWMLRMQETFGAFYLAEKQQEAYERIASRLRPSLYA
jgi:hypothetical protein